MYFFSHVSTFDSLKARWQKKSKKISLNAPLYSDFALVTPLLLTPLNCDYTWVTCIWHLPRLYDAGTSSYQWSKRTSRHSNFPAQSSWPSQQADRLVRLAATAVQWPLHWTEISSGLTCFALPVLLAGLCFFLLSCLHAKILRLISISGGSIREFWESCIVQSFAALRKSWIKKESA
jgi:hypothetical protein